MVNLLTQNFFPLEYIALLDKLLVTCKRSVHYYVDLKIIKYMSDEKPVKGRRFFLQFNVPSNTFVVFRFRTCSIIAINNHF